MILVTLGILAAVSSLTEATVCKNDTDCGAGECCYIQPEFIVVSKRQLVLPDQPNNKRDTGVCERYRLPDDPCGVLEVLNGHCGCTAGYSCQFVPDPTATVVGTGKRKIAVPGPGAYKCVPEQ